MRLQRRGALRSSGCLLIEQFQSLVALIESFVALVEPLVEPLVAFIEPLIALGEHREQPLLPFFRAHLERIQPRYRRSDARVHSGLDGLDARFEFISRYASH